MLEFVMLVGLPGCGKSTWASEKASSTGAIWISSDNIRKEMNFGPGEGSNIVFAEMENRTLSALKNGRSVIYDATNLTRKHRMTLLQKISKILCFKICSVFAEPIEICYTRNAQRSGFDRVPDEVIHHMLLSFQVPMKCEGFDIIQVCKTSNDGKSLYDYIKMTVGFNQHNHHHNLDLFDHLQRASEYVSQHALADDDELVEIAARYHDIGKVITQTYTDGSGNTSEEAHYYGHENAGAYIFLSTQDWMSDYTALYVASLINWHMRPYVSMGDRKRKAEIQLVGEKFWRRVMLLHEADMSAK